MDTTSRKTIPKWYHPYMRLSLKYVGDYELVLLERAEARQHSTDKLVRELFDCTIEDLKTLETKRTDRLLYVEDWMCDKNGIYIVFIARIGRLLRHFQENLQNKNYHLKK